MGLYPFQERVYDLISAGRSVVLQAPTGAGKTRAALYPFLRAWEEQSSFPCKCIYSVPMRVLANQFWAEYDDRVRNFGFVRPLDVTVQTGARPEDRKLEGNLIFTTIDQTLSNFLNIPYALSLSQGNLNAGAVVSSYLVFDELHLFDPETALPTTLHLLRLLRGVVPFLVMTATFSTERLQMLAAELGAVPLVLSEEEAAAIPSQKKTRRIHTIDSTVTAQAVWERHQRRSVAICNTVKRAQDLYEALSGMADSQCEVRLLHSRFLRRDRDANEAWLQQEFGKDQGRYTTRSAILVATQVVEVGLDISSEALHTELAPAAAVIQRAGRCARYEGEEGDVFVYQLPPDKKGDPAYAPYHTAGQSEVCELTWKALESRSGQVCGFGQELKIIDEAHGAADQILIEKWRANRHYLADLVGKTIAAQERGAAPELIRDVDSRTVVVHPEPSGIENPWDYEGFGIHRGSLFGAYDDLEALADVAGAEWVMMTADAVPDEENERARTIWKWRCIKSEKDLVGALLVAVNPALIRYSATTGFQLGVAAGDADWQSPLSERNRERQRYPPYRRETMTEHVARMMRVYRYPFMDRTERQERRALAEELAYASRRLEQRQGWPLDTLDRLIRVAIVAHDLGKLDVGWQRWAHRWQAEVSRLRGADLTIPASYMAAHTDYDENNPTEKELNRKLRSQRPNHAAESAGVAAGWLLAQAGNPTLARATLTAVIAHHSAGTIGEHKAFAAHAESRPEFARMLAEAGLEKPVEQALIWKLPEGKELVNRRMIPSRNEELLAYLLIVRALRLADQRSQMW